MNGEVVKSFAFRFTTRFSLCLAMRLSLPYLSLTHTYIAHLMDGKDNIEKSKKGFSTTRKP